MAPPRTGEVQRRAGSGGAPSLHGRNTGAGVPPAPYTQYGGTADGGVLASAGQANGAAGYKAKLAQAKAEVALARQSGMVAGNAAYLTPLSSGLSGVSFAPIGAGDLGPAARFAAHAGVPAATETFTPGEIAGGVDMAGQPRTGDNAANSGTMPGMSETLSPTMRQADFARALDACFARLSRLPPIGGAAFNPCLSPLWAGLKLPG